MLFVATKTVCLRHILSCQRCATVLSPTQALGSCVLGGKCPTGPHTRNLGRRLFTFTLGHEEQTFLGPFSLILSDSEALRRLSRRQLAPHRSHLGFILSFKIRRDRVSILMRRADYQCDNK